MQCSRELFSSLLTFVQGMGGNEINHIFKEDDICIFLLVFEQVYTEWFIKQGGRIPESPVIVNFM